MERATLHLVHYEAACIPWAPSIRSGHAPAGVVDSPPMSTVAPTALSPAAHARALAEHLAPFSGGRSVTEIAESLQTTATLEEAVDRGWFSPAERRQIEGRATRADLEELGYPAAEIEEILEEQKRRR
jgi:hypothetical protein